MAAQMQPKAMACAAPKGSSYRATARRSWIVGEMYISIPISPRVRRRAPTANRNSGSAVAGPVRSRRATSLRKVCAGASVNAAR